MAGGARQYVHAIDVLPTLLDAMGIQPPATLAGIAQTPLEGVSFAHTFADGAAATGKRVQYYEMIGSRAIWADGWKAVVEQPQGGVLTEEMLDAQHWELYHVAEDFSEVNNLADVYPDRLRALIDQWWVEAGKYKVLPLDARMQLRMGERKPSARAPSRRYVYEPMGAPQFEYTAVNLKNRSHSITARAHIPAAGAQGVLLAHGSWFAGYSLFVQNDRLVYVHNYLGLQEYRVESTVPVPRGDCTLAMHFTATGEHQGHAELRINDDAVGSGLIARTVPAVIETSGEGLCCGYDSGLPVTPGYEAPFRFTGILHEVVVLVDDPTVPDHDSQLRAAWNEQ